MNCYVSDFWKQPDISFVASNIALSGFHTFIHIIKKSVFPAAYIPNQLLHIPNRRQSCFSFQGRAIPASAATSSGGHCPGNHPLHIQPCQPLRAPCKRPRTFQGDCCARTAAWSRVASARFLIIGSIRPLPAHRTGLHAGCDGCESLRPEAVKDWPEISELMAC